MREVKKFLTDNSLVVSGYYKVPFNFDGTILQIVVTPPQPNSSYNFGIKDEDGFVIFSRFGVTGNLIADNLDLIVFPGEKHLIIENARPDGFYRVKIVYQL